MVQKRHVGGSSPEFHLASAIFELRKKYDYDGAEDGEFLVKEMPGLTAEDLTNLDRFQAYVKLLIDLTPTKPFSLSGIKSPNAGTGEMSAWLKKSTRVKYTKPPVKFSPIPKVTTP